MILNTPAAGVTVINPSRIAEPLPIAALSSGVNTASKLWTIDAASRIGIRTPAAMIVIGNWMRAATA